MNDYKPKFCLLVTVLFITVSALTIYAADPVPPVGQSKSPAEQSKSIDQLPKNDSTIPSGQSKSKKVTEEEGISSDIFGDQGGRYHPFIILQEVYTNNLFATRDNRSDDFITTISPGIWLAFPANREKLLSMDTTTTSPGGLKLSRVKPEASRRYQTYFLYSPEYVLYADHSDQDHFDHRAEALFQYNLNSGLSFDLMDIFHDREEIAGNGTNDTLYRHQDNLLDFIATYEPPSGKLKLQFNYSNYYLGYKDNVVSYRDRNDNSFGASIFYKFWPKTSLFIEYDHSVIEFDSASIYDNTENRYYGGVTWELTAKTRGTLKLGFTQKDFDSSTVEDEDGFSVELQAQHNLTAKRALQINGYRKFHESDQAGASSFLSTGIDIGLLQQFTEKWSGTFTVFYEMNEYNSFARDDDYYGFSPAIRFKPKKWMMFDLGYYYYNNNSSNTIYDYDAYQILLRATVSM